MTLMNQTRFQMILNFFWMEMFLIQADNGTAFIINLHQISLFKN